MRAISDSPQKGNRPSIQLEAIQPTNARLTPSLRPYCDLSTGRMFLTNTRQTVAKATPNSGP